jgi:para-nitrobenzyl esterase
MQRPLFGKALTVAAAAALGFLSPAAAQNRPTVTTEAGVIMGVASGDVLAFKGIPYAAPPLGDLRWRAPQPVEPWKGVREATELGHVCMQIPLEDAVSPIDTTPSEDCLFLNVWRSADAAADPLPVMVWIHGGWYVNGGSSTATFDGSALARSGLVVVTINYRLGRFGFFAHPALLAADEGPVGNFGYMDQIAALRWVQDNIAAFGGDPNAVTIAGESAGGGSVIHLLVSPEARGLFHRVIAMSGGGRRGLSERAMTGGTPEAPSADMLDAAFATEHGITGDGAETLAALRALPAEDLLAGVAFPVFTQRLLTEEDASAVLPGTPMIDGVIVTDKLENLVLGGAAAPVPLMIGTTAVDAPGFFPPRNDPFSWFGPDAEVAAAAYNPTGALPIEAVLLQISMDMTMHEPARFLARAVTAAGNPAWLYRFTYLAEGTEDRSRGARHAWEVPYMFGTLDRSLLPGAGDATTDNDRQMEVWFSTYVANFIRTGDPNGGDLLAWPKFDPAAFDLMHFTLDDGPVFGPDPRADGVELVERVQDARAGSP